jgi:hypothetical protein
MNIRRPAIAHLLIFGSSRLILYRAARARQRMRGEVIEPVCPWSCVELDN